MAIQSTNSTEQTHQNQLLDAALYCEEEQRWEEEEDDDEDGVVEQPQPSSLLPSLLLRQDLFWEDEELASLFSKEKAQRSGLDPGCVRGEAVAWMLRVAAHYGFSALTAVLAIDYVDRFLSSFHLLGDKTWMIQLVAVACLSLAAKVEETYVPLLLNLQVGEAKYAFEAKAIQRMELLVLSTLKWKMHPVTPLSFLDHIIRRLGLKREVHWEFFRKCESLLLSVVSDSRSVGYLPSILATATMMHVIEDVETTNPIEYKSQLLRALRMSEEEVDNCYRLVSAISSTDLSISRKAFNSPKRKHETESSSLIGSCTFEDVSGEEQDQPLAKRSRVQLLENKNNSCNSPGSNLPCRVFINAVRSPH